MKCDWVDFQEAAVPDGSPVSTTYQDTEGGRQGTGGATCQERLHRARGTEPGGAGNVRGHAERRASYSQQVSPSYKCH